MELTSGFSAIAASSPYENKNKNKKEVEIAKSTFWIIINIKTEFEKK